MHEISRFKRLEEIIKHTSLSGKTDIKSLSKLFGVSVDTIRRDIKELAESGRLEAVRGGAISKSVIPTNYADRLTFNLNEKREIAIKALPLIEDEQVVILSGGTSIVALASILPLDKKLTVITNSILVVNVLENHDNIEILFAGGRLSKKDLGTLGSQTIHFFDFIRADILFIAPLSIDAEYGITSNSLESAELDRMMNATSKKTVALVTSNKLDTADNFYVCGLNKVDILITDLDVENEKLLKYKSKDVIVL